MQAGKTDPRLVALSVAAYRASTGLYPQSYREDYAPHMAQVFRDYSLATYRREGPRGLPPLWARTWLDLLRTAVEEHLYGGTTMTRDTFIRLSGWGMILGTLLLVLAFSGLAGQPRIQGYLYDMLGAPTEAVSYARMRAAADALSSAIFLAGLALVALGLLGLQLRYGKQAGRLGEISLWLSILAGAVAFFVVLGWMIGLDIGWRWFAWSLILQALCLGLFGVAAVRHKPMPRGNALPLLAGLPGSLTALAVLLAETINGTTLDLGLLGSAIYVLTIACVVLLGYTLAAAEPESAAVEVAA